MSTPPHTLDLSIVEAILFDLDGTLVETDNRWARLMGQRLAFLRRLNRRLDTDRLGRDIVMAIETPSNYAISLLERLGLGKSIYGLADRVRRSRGLATRDASVLIEGTRELLGSLEGRFRLAVVTTRARPEALAFLAQQGLACLFSVVVTRQDVWHIKPHPEPIRRAAKLLGVCPGRCLMVGDTTVDVRAARRAGAVAVAVLSGFGGRDELRHAGAHLILDSVADLVSYLPLTEPSDAPPRG
jgi:HAD superfamily hydrolase (TIGR01549 family)